QFNGPIFENQKKEISQAGAVLYDYLPDNAFVVRMNSSIKSQVSSLEFVKWIGEYKASYKYEPVVAISTDLPKSISSEEKADLLVLLFDANDNSRIAKEIARTGGSVIETSSNMMRIEIEKSRVNEIASISGISWIEEYREAVLSNDVAVTIVGITPVHEIHKLNGSGQIVAVCDTGLDTGNKNTIHADLRGRIIDIFDVADDGSVADQNGHGTHVAGSVLGNGALSGGNYSGMAPEAELVFQAAGNDSDYLYLPVNLSDVFQPAYDLGAKIHTNSWGDSLSGAYTTDAREIDRFMWEHPDMLILFAAGNEGVDSDLNGVIDHDSIDSPATSKNCIAVGSSENYREEFLTQWGNSY
ncbi:MAG: S8 family serine peptidase, partial [Firmicutes bacterium]|nr:S8 family serine peptidase [Bacillota bacterium]